MGRVEYAVDPVVALRSPRKPQPEPLTSASNTLGECFLISDGLLAALPMSGHTTTRTTRAVADHDDRSSKLSMPTSPLRAGTRGWLR